MGVVDYIDFFPTVQCLLDSSSIWRREAIGEDRFSARGKTLHSCRIIMAWANIASKSQYMLLIHQYDSR